MIGGTERLLEARRAVPADRQKSIGEAEALFLTNASQPLAQGNRDRGCHALTSQLGQFLCHQVSLAILDIQSHFSTFLAIVACENARGARGRHWMPQFRRPVGLLAAWSETRRLLWQLKMCPG
jgi:hypothetical protein